MSVGLPQGFDFNADFGEVDDSMQMRKDRRLAGRDPAAYCADRCVSTGNCDIFEGTICIACKNYHNNIIIKSSVYS